MEEITSNEYTYEYVCTEESDIKSDIDLLIETILMSTTNPKVISELNKERELVLAEINKHYLDAINNKKFISFILYKYTVIIFDRIINKESLKNYLDNYESFEKIEVILLPQINDEFLINKQLKLFNIIFEKNIRSLSIAAEDFKENLFKHTQFSIRDVLSPQAEKTIKQSYKFSNELSIYITNVKTLTESTEDLTRLFAADNITSYLKKLKIYLVYESKFCKHFNLFINLEVNKTEVLNLSTKINELQQKIPSLNIEIYSEKDIKWTNYLKVFNNTKVFEYSISEKGHDKLEAEISYRLYYDFQSLWHALKPEIRFTPTENPDEFDEVIDKYYSFIVESKLDDLFRIYHRLRYFLPPLAVDIMFDYFKYHDYTENQKNILDRVSKIIKDKFCPPETFDKFYNILASIKLKHHIKIDYVLPNDITKLESFIPFTKFNLVPNLTDLQIKNVPEYRLDGKDAKNLRYLKLNDVKKVSLKNLNLQELYLNIKEIDILDNVNIIHLTIECPEEVDNFNRILEHFKEVQKLTIIVCGYNIILKGFSILKSLTIKNKEDCKPLVTIEDSYVTKLVAERIYCSIEYPFSIVTLSLSWATLLNQMEDFILYTPNN